MFKILKALFKKFATMFSKIALEVLSEQIGITKDRVIALALDLENDKTLTGAQKHEKLVSQLKALLLLSGKEFSTHMLNKLVLAAVDVLRGKA